MVNILSILKEQKDSKLKGNLYHITQILFAYNTNHIEGSTLTEEQTRYIYETNTLITADNDTTTDIDDIIEMSNHFKLVDFMIDNATSSLSEDLIKKFHTILKTGTSSERLSWFNIGEYKKLPNEVNGNTTSAPEDVEKDMKALLNWYNSIDNVKFEDIIKFHSKFEKIHPFQDGNGRVGRIIMFKECLKNNIIPFIILDQDKLFYYRGLNEYQNNREKGYLIDTCLNAQDQYKLLITKYLNINFEE